MGKIEESAGKDRVQVYEDKGAGYSEETAYFGGQRGYFTCDCISYRSKVWNS